MMASTAWFTSGWVVAHEMTDTRMCAATIVLPRRHRLMAAGRACSFVSLAEAAPYDLDSLAEGMQLRGVVFTPAKENNQALTTGHDQCATQFAFFHRQCRIDFANELCKEPRELFLYLYDDIARKRFMQRQPPTFE